MFLFKLILKILACPVIGLLMLIGWILAFLFYCLLCACRIVFAYGSGHVSYGADGRAGSAEDDGSRFCMLHHAACRERPCRVGTASGRLMNFIMS